MAREFTSGGTSKLELDYDRYEIPDQNNLYGILGFKTSKHQTANHFDNIGWSVRKNTWTDYEIESTWAKLTIEGKNEILLNGVIDEQKFDELKTILDNFKLDFSIELYNSKQEKIKTATNNK